MPVSARLAIAVLVAGWTVTFAIWQTDGAAEGRANGLWACGDIRGPGDSPYVAAEIETAGLGCGEARGFVRRVHRACRAESCRLSGYECTLGDDRTASCERTAAPSMRLVWAVGQARPASAPR